MNISGTFNLEADLSWSQSQTRKIILDVDTSEEAATINLPAIADVVALNGTGVQIVVNDAAGNAGANNITVVADTSGTANYIEGAANNVINANTATRIYGIANDVDQWYVIA